MNFCLICSFCLSYLISKINQVQLSSNQSLPFSHMALDSALLTVLIPVVLLIEIEVLLISDLYFMARFLQQGSLPKHLTNPRLNDLLNIQPEQSLRTQVCTDKAIINFLGKFKLQTVYVWEIVFLMISPALNCLALIRVYNITMRHQWSIISNHLILNFYKMASVVIFD